MCIAELHTLGLGHKVTSSSLIKAYGEFPH